VLTGDRPALFKAGVKDRTRQFLGGVGLAGDGVVVEDQRVQVAIARVEDVGDPDARLLG
jgi:hypothetical protein